jgi:hypothetical protein
MLAFFGQALSIKREERSIAVRGRMALLEQSAKRGKEYVWIADLQLLQRV